MRKLSHLELNLIDQWVKEGKVKKILNLAPFPERIVSPRCHCTLVSVDEGDRADRPFSDGAMIVQEDPIDQIKRMVEHLPVTNECPEDASGCLRLVDLMITPWARGFLKQMIRDHERRTK